MKLPFSLVNGDSLVGADGSRLRLEPGIRDFLEFARSRGLILSLASWNEPAQALAALRLLKLLDYFKYPKAEPHPDKADMIRRILSDLRKECVSVDAGEILYVDDRTKHIDRIYEEIGNIKFLKYGVDFKDWTGLRGILVSCSDQGPVEICSCGACCSDKIRERNRMDQNDAITT
jgi:magnesium-dependent phosphatase-1